MAVSLDQLRISLSSQAGDLSALADPDRPGLVAQQLLYQSRLDASTEALAGPATARLRALTARRPQALALRTRWTTSRMRVRFRPNRGEIHALDVCADGSTVLFSGDDATLYRWLPRSGSGRPQRLGTLGQHIAAIACDAAANWAVTGDQDGKVHLWPLTAAAPAPVPLWQHQGYVRQARISAAGDVVVSIGDDPGIAVWRAAVEPGDVEILAEAAYVQAMSLARNGAFVVYATADGLIWRHPLRAGAGPSQAAVIGTAAGSRVHHLAVTDDGGRVVCGTKGGFLRVWDLPPAGPRAADPDSADPDSADPDSADPDSADPDSGEIIGHNALPLWSLALTSDGTTAVAGATDGRVLSWDLAGTGQRPGTVLGIHDRAVSVVAVDNASGTVFSAGRDGVVLRCQLYPGARPADREQDFEVWTVRAGPGAGTALTAGKNGMHVWDLDAAGRPAPVRVSGASVKTFACFPDGAGLAALTHDFRILIGVIGDGVPRVLNPAGAHRIADLAVVPDCQSIVTAGQDGAVRRWPLGPGAGDSVLVGSHGPCQIRSLAMAPDGSYVICADHRRRLLRWDLDDQERPALQHIRPPQRSPAPLRCLAITADGEWLIAGDDIGNVWRLGTAVFGTSQLLGRHKPGTKVRALAVSPDSTWVASAADDGELRCWAVNGGGLLGRFVPAALPRSLAISGGRLLVGDRNGGLTLFEVLGTADGVTPEPARVPDPLLIRLTAQPPGLVTALLGTATAEQLVQAEELLLRAFAAPPVPVLTASALKNRMLRLDPGFDEKRLGFPGFRDFLRQLPHRVRFAGASGMDVVLELVDPERAPASAKIPGSAATPAPATEPAEPPVLAEEAVPPATPEGQ